MKTYMAKPAEVERKWYVVDATDMVLGRLASQVAMVLRGKNKPTVSKKFNTRNLWPKNPNSSYTKPSRGCFPKTLSAVR